MRFFLFASLVCILSCTYTASAKLSLAKPLSEHAILQANKPITIWGEASPGQKIRVLLGNKSHITSANKQGKWKLVFDALKASYRPLRLEVSANSETITRENLLIGEVWLASGQSNMQWPLKQSTGGTAEIARSADPYLRFLHHHGTLHPNGKKYPRSFLAQLSPNNYYQCPGWQSSTPSASPHFSASAYYFAKMLRQKLNVPVGIIALPVGGSPIESHLPKQAFEKHPALKPLLRDWWINPEYPQWCRQRAALNLTYWLADPQPDKDPPHPFAPTFLWQAGIEPLKNYAIRGVIWYQGESNATVDGGSGKAISKPVNQRKLKALIHAYRQHWQDGTLPFYHVQLPGLNRDWAIFREMQQDVTDSSKAVGLAITVDIGHPTNVHPPDKKPVGDRLARLALKMTYQKDISCHGPRPSTFIQQENRVIIEYGHTGSLKTSDNQSPRTFEIAGSDGIFHPAAAKIIKNRISLTSKFVSRPHSIRYAWSNDPDVNLINHSGLPAHPFRKTLSP